LLLLALATCTSGEPAPAQDAGPVPVVFNASRSARPGDLVSLQGANLGEAPEVWLDVPGGKPLRLPAENSVDACWVAARIPADAKGALVVRVRNGAASSRPVFLNRALPLHLDALEIVPSGTFHIFGPNLFLPGSEPVVTVNGRRATLCKPWSGQNGLQVDAPDGLAPGPATITVDNGNGSGPATLDRPVLIGAADGNSPLVSGIGWTAAFAPIVARTFPVGAPAGGDAEDSAAIQEAVDRAAAGGGGRVTLGEGTYRIRRTVTLKSRVLLDGRGADKTILRYEKSNYPIWANGADLIGISLLRLEHAGAVEGPLIKGNTRVVLQHVVFDLHASQQLYLSENRNIAVVGCDFNQGASVRGQGPYTFSNSAGLHFVRNWTRWKDGAPSFQESHDAYLADNMWTRDASVQNTPVITTHCCVIDFCHRIAVVANHFGVVNGPVTNRERNDGETLLTEGGGGHRTENLGSVAEATASTLTDPANTIDVHPLSKDSIPENYGVAIVDGTGAGQTRRVLGYASHTLTVDPPWDVIPDRTSRYATFVWGLEKSLLWGNTLEGNPRGIWLYQCAVRDVDVLDNELKEGGGIYLRTWQSLAEKQFTPIYNVRIAGNKIANTTGIWVSHIGSVFVTKEPRPFGIGQIGIEVRNNKVTANEKNLQLNAEDYASIEGCFQLLKPEGGKYEAPALPPFLGTIFERNTCENCDVAFRLGTGAEGAILSGNRIERCKELWTDTPASAGAPASRKTVVR
jgi:hypothetical protein